MIYKIDFQTAQKICGLVASYFENVARSAPEFPDGIKPRGGDFSAYCHNLTFNPAALEGAEFLDKKVVALVRAVLRLAE